MTTRTKPSPASALHVGAYWGDLLLSEANPSILQLNKYSAFGAV